MMGLSDHTVRALAGYAGAILAFASAATTAYWTLGGTALLDTVGGALERLARDRGLAAVMLGCGVTVAKCAAGGLALALLRRRSPSLTTLAVVGGIALALYGAVLTIAGALILSGAVDVAAENEHALRWHVMLWDPWFALWGIALAVTGLMARRSSPTGP